MQDKKITDEEVLAILNKLSTTGFETEEETIEAVFKIKRAYPCAQILDLIKSNLSSEEILAEAKKAKPILL